MSAGPDPAHHTVALDESSTRWLASLGAHGTQRDEAVAELHALLLRAARVETTRRAAGLSARDRDDLAMQAADDALMHVLDKLETFEGRSRFITWAYKFAIYEAGVKARRRNWQDGEVALEAEPWPLKPTAAVANYVLRHIRCMLLALVHAAEGRRMNGVAEAATAAEPLGRCDRHGVMLLRPHGAVAAR